MEVSNNMHCYYDDMRQAIVVPKCSFYNCLSPAAAVIERQKRECHTVELFSWLKHMYNQMNQLENNGVGVFVAGDICVI